MEEIEDISERWWTKPEKRLKARYGYQIINGTYVEHEDEQEILKFVIRNRKKGATMAMIVEELNKKGRVTRYGKSWEKQQVWTILDQNGFYDKKPEWLY